MKDNRVIDQNLFSDDDEIPTEEDTDQSVPDESKAESETKSNDGSNAESNTDSSMQKDKSNDADSTQTHESEYMFSNKQYDDKLNNIAQTVNMLSEKSQSIDDKIMTVQNSINGKLEEISENLQASVLEQIKQVLDKQDRNDKQLSRSLQLNADFEDQVRKGTQAELNQLKNEKKDEVYDAVLEDIANVYALYSGLFNVELSDVTRKNIDSLFESLRDTLERYGAQFIKSEPGILRPARTCKIYAKVPTADKNLNNTIIDSRNYGIIHGQKVLYPEYVKVYVYDENYKPEEPVVNTQPEEPVPLNEKIIDNNVDTADNNDGTVSPVLDTDGNNVSEDR